MRLTGSIVSFDLPSSSCDRICSEYQISKCLRKKSFTGLLRLSQEVEDDQYVCWQYDKMNVVVFQ